MSATDSPNARVAMASQARPALGGRPFAFPATGSLTVQHVALGSVIGLGFFLRLLASVRLSPHLDEASSILAAQAAAAHGWPIFPSGTVYFQGATLSWLLMPLVWLGYGTLDQLDLLRFPIVLIGTLAVYLCYRLGLAVLGDPRIALAMAALVAIDPSSVQWSGHVRMYAPLQALTVALALALVPMFGHVADFPSATADQSVRRDDDGPRDPLRSGRQPYTTRPGAGWRRLGVVVALFWLAVFTHVGAALLLPAMGLAFLLIHRRMLWRRLDLLATLALCALAPLMLLTLNRVLGAASVESRDTSSKPWSFVGDNLLQPLGRIQRGFTLDVMETLGRTSQVIGLIVAAATLIAAWQSSRLSGERARRVALGLLCLYWVPVVTTGVFTVYPKERYFLHLHTLGYLFVAWLVVRQARGAGALLVRFAPAVGVTVAIVLVLLVRLANPVVQPDYHAAMAWVESHQEPGEPVIVARPAIGYLGLDETRRADLVYLAGSEDQPRSRRYTRLTSDGELIDYWVGIDAIVTTDGLRRFLEANPDAWIVLDEGHLTAPLAYGGEIEQVLREMTRVVHRTPGGGLVLRAT